MPDDARGASSLASSLMAVGDGFPPNLKSLFNSPSEGRDPMALGFRIICGAIISSKSLAEAVAA